MRDVRYWIGFNRVYGVGPAKVRALIDHFGDLETAWQADPNDLQEAGLDRRSIENLLSARADDRSRSRNRSGAEDAARGL